MSAPYRPRLQPQDYALLVEWRDRGDWPTRAFRNSIRRLKAHGLVELGVGGLYRLSLRGAIEADKARARTA